MSRQRQRVPWRAPREARKNREGNELREKEKNRGRGWRRVPWLLSEKGTAVNRLQSDS